MSQRFLGVGASRKADMRLTTRTAVTAVPALCALAMVSVPSAHADTLDGSIISSSDLNTGEVDDSGDLDDGGMGCLRIGRVKICW